MCGNLKVQHPVFWCKHRLSLVDSILQEFKEAHIGVLGLVGQQSKYKGKHSPVYLGMEYVKMGKERWTRIRCPITKHTLSLSLRHTFSLSWPMLRTRWCGYHVDQYHRRVEIFPQPKFCYMVHRCLSLHGREAVFHSSCAKRIYRPGKLVLVGSYPQQSHHSRCFLVLQAPRRR